MARSFFLLLVLPIAASGWGSTFHPSSSQYSKRASKRSRPVWKTSLDGERSGAERGRSVGMSVSSGGDSAGSGSGSGSGLGDSGGKEWVDDGRDSLPFVVYDAAPPPRKVGVANLPPLTGTGDTLWHGAKHYKVLRVSNHYKYEGGRFVVRRKSIQAKELKRVAKERVVARLVYGEGKNSPPPSSS
ncbi:unnamed protein product [Scytosiphon promiscuus]